MITRLLVANWAAPSKKVTLPVGVPPAGGTAATLAVKLIDWPKTEGLAALVKVVVVLAGALTSWLRAAEVLPPKLASPLYEAVMLCVPAARAL